MRNIRLISIVMLASICCASCEGSDDIVEGIDSTAGTTTVASETIAAPTGLYYTTDEATVTELGLDGYEYNIYLRPENNTWSNKDIYIEEATGDNFDDAVHKRQTMIEEQFGFNIRVTYSADTYLSELSTLVLAGDDTYDLAFPMIKQAATYAAAGILTDLSEVEYVDLDSEVWSEVFIDTVTIGGSLYMLCGDISTNVYDALSVFMFNKKLHKDFGLEDPYTLVREGKWTLDKFNSMASAVSSDLNGDGMRDPGDQWGMAFTNSNGGTHLFFGCGAKLTEKDENDIPVLALNNERTVNVFEKVKTLFGDRDTYLAFGTSTEDDALCNDVWTEGRSLFKICGLFGMKKFRDMNTDFGILPMAKYDEEQEDYIQFIDDWCPSPAVIPITAKNPARSGFLLQLLAETGREIILPEYYEKCLVGKYIRDNESADMLDYSTENYVLENANIFKWGGLSSSFFAAILGIGDADVGIASLSASYSSQVEAAIAATIESFRSH